MLSQARVPVTVYDGKKNRLSYDRNAQPEARDVSTIDSVFNADLRDLGNVTVEERDVSAIDSVFNMEWEARQ